MFMEMGAFIALTFEDEGCERPPLRTCGAGCC